MNKIEQIIDIEFEQRKTSNNLELVLPLKKYIREGENDTKRDMASSILNNISRYHKLKDTFEFFVSVTQKEKSKHLKTQFIRHLQDLEPNSASLDYLLSLTQKREIIIKRNAFRALKLIKDVSLESYILKKIETEKDNGVIQAAISGLKLNGTIKSLDPLMQKFKTSRDGSIRAEIVKVLEHIIDREELNNDQTTSISKFSQKSKLGFENIWKGSPKIISKDDIIIQAEAQLVNNKLNLEFGIDENFKANIYIDKMKKDYLRFFNYSISSLEKPTFYRDIKIDSFGTGTGVNYTEFLDKHDQMKPSIYAQQIVETIEKISIPYIYDIHLGCKKVLDWNFARLIKNYEEVLENLKIKHDFVELSYFVQLSKYKKHDNEYKEYIKHCLNLWDQTKSFKTYRTREYLQNELVR